MNNEHFFKSYQCSLFNCHLSFLRPQNALVFLGDRTESFVDELLDALAAIGFPCVDISFRIGGDAMHAVEFSGLASAFSERRQQFQGIPFDDVNLRNCCGGGALGS